MIPPTLEAVIETIFKEKATEALVAAAVPNDDLSKIKETENIEILYAKVVWLFDKTIKEITEGTILLVDLISARQEFYQAGKRINSIEIKEQQDVFDMKKEMKWHEKSQFVRLFVSSDKGDQLDEEKKEAKVAKSIAKQFVNKLKNFEAFLDEYILTAGTKYDDSFLLLVEKWKEMSTLNKGLLSARKNIRKGQSKLKTRVSCGDSSCEVDNSRSKKHFASAIKQLDKHLAIYQPQVEALTEKVASKISQVRTLLLINE